MTKHLKSLTAEKAEEQREGEVVAEYEVVKAEAGVGGEEGGRAQRQQQCEGGGGVSNNVNQVKSGVVRMGQISYRLEEKKSESQLLECKILVLLHFRWKI